MALAALVQLGTDMVSIPCSPEPFALSTAPEGTIPRKASRHVLEVALRAGGVTLAVGGAAYLLASAVAPLVTVAGPPPPSPSS